MGSHESMCVCVCVCVYERERERAPKILMRDAGAVANVIRSVWRGRVWHAANDYKIQRQASARRTARQSLSSENKTNLSWHSGTTVESLAGTGSRSVNALQCGRVKTPARWITPLQLDPQHRRTQLSLVDSQDPDKNKNHAIEGQCLRSWICGVFYALQTQTFGFLWYFLKLFCKFCLCKYWTTLAG